jgi:hypothetical protein
MENKPVLKIETRVVIRKGNDLYYLLKVVRQEFDVYCAVPNLGLHHSLHKSGTTHFLGDKASVAPENQPPVIVMSASAGYKQGNDFVVSSLEYLNEASGIFSAIYSSIDDPSKNDYKRLNRNIRECFVIDAMSFPKDTSKLEIGVWAVSKGGECNFTWNNPGITESMLFKVERCEPQIWIYARPFQHNHQNHLSLENSRAKQ